MIADDVDDVFINI